MRLLRALVITVALHSASLAAQLKPEVETGSRIPKAPEEFPIDRTREVVALFAECGVKKFAQLAHDMVLDVAKFRVDNRYLKAADPDCLVQATSAPYAVVQLRMDPQTFRAAAADALVKRNLASFDPTQVKSAAPLKHPSVDPADYVPKPGARNRWKQADYDETKKRDLAAVWLLAFGECAVRANPVGARNILQTKINSDEELQALWAMMPAFSACLDRGRQLGTERAALRGAVALNYYRLAFAPKLDQTEPQE